MCVRKRERERKLLFLFLKGMTGALAPFSYLVYNKTDLSGSFTHPQNNMVPKILPENVFHDLEPINGRSGVNI